MNRYNRQIMVPEFGANGQAKLEAAHVLVIGAGGLAAPVLMYLVGAGVGKITLVDPDIVELGNLHRQPLFVMSDIGQAKVLAAKARLATLNPETTLLAINAALTPNNVGDLIKGADIIVDAADSFAVSYILSDQCLKTQTPLISASVLGQTGYVGGFCGLNPSLRAVFPALPENDLSCVTAGVLGPSVGVVGAMQAQICIQVIIGAKPSPMGRLTTVDLVTYRFGGFDFHGASEPTFYFPFIGKLDIDESDLVIELRSTEEAANPVVPWALRGLPELEIDPYNLHERRVVLCCKSGLRAWRAANELQAQGLKRLALLALDCAQ